jgi:hypothetical protein
VKVAGLLPLAPVAKMLLFAYGRFTVTVPEVLVELHATGIAHELLPARIVQEFGVIDPEAVRVLAVQMLPFHAVPEAQAVFTIIWLEVAIRPVVVFLQTM